MPKTPMSKGRLVTILAILVILMLGPFALLSIWWWPGIIGIAFYGVITVGIAWISGGTRHAIYVLVAFSALMVLALLIAGNAWLSAALVLVLGIAYGIAARFGWAQTMLEIPILIPYFLMAPPFLFTQNAPTIDLGYLAATVAFVLAGGLWTLFLLSRLKPHSQPPPAVRVSKDRAVVYGLVLGISSAVGVFLAITLVPTSNWAWLTLTLYVLANPVKDFDWQKMRDRLLGTIAGFVVVSLIFLATDNQAVMYAIAAVTGWLCLSAMALGVPYWAYVAVLTPTVVLVTATSSAREIFADQRLDFTVLGIVLTIVVASVAHVVLKVRERSSQDPVTAD